MLPSLGAAVCSFMHCVQDRVWARSLHSLSIMNTKVKIQERKKREKEKNSNNNSRAVAVRRMLKENSLLAYRKLQLRSVTHCNSTNFRRFSRRCPMGMGVARRSGSGAAEAHVGLLFVGTNPRSLARPKTKLGPFKEGYFNNRISCFLALESTSRGCSCSTRWPIQAILNFPESQFVWLLNSENSGLLSGTGPELVHEL